MIRVLITRTRLSIVGHAHGDRDAAKVCASVSTIARMLDHRCIHSEVNKHPRASVTMFGRVGDALDEAAERQLLWLAIEYPQHVRLKTA